MLDRLSACPPQQCDTSHQDKCRGKRAHSLAEPVPRTSPKSMIAWFKLAELVGRRERERTFVTYRLLSHGLPDVALIAQLEGDLFVAFNDTKALGAYKRAIELYEASGRTAEAILLSDQLTRLASSSHSL